MADKIVDARGLSCPQPVLLVMENMKRLKKGSLEVLVDTDTSRENVARAARMEGWEVSEDERTEEGYRLILEKKS